MREIQEARQVAEPVSRLATLLPQRNKVEGQTHIYAEPSPIRTVTVGPGFPPGLSIVNRDRLSTRGLNEGIHVALRLTAGRELHPAPKVSIY